ncbi:hypothetical protein FACS189459_4260 [Bacilli bacterium]|nr:hypothetical protein FACS189459_4260 [Bacilli bacterium]
MLLEFSIILKYSALYYNIFMKQMLVNLKLEENIKNSFTNICDNLGLSPTAMFYIFVKKTIIENGIPFPMINDYDGSQNAKKIKESFNQISSKEHVSLIKNLGFDNSNIADE